MGFGFGVTDIPDDVREALVGGVGRDVVRILPRHTGRKTVSRSDVILMLPRKLDDEFVEAVRPVPYCQPPTQVRWRNDRFEAGQANGSPNPSPLVYTGWTIGNQSDVILLLTHQ